MANCGEQRLLKDLFVSYSAGAERWLHAKGWGPSETYLACCPKFIVVNVIVSVSKSEGVVKERKTAPIKRKE